MKYYINYGGSSSEIFRGLTNISAMASNGIMYTVNFRDIDTNLEIVTQQLPSGEFVYNVTASNNVFNENPGGAGGYYYNFDGTFNQLERITPVELRRILDQMNIRLPENSIDTIELYVRETYQDNEITREDENINVIFENGINIKITITENFYSIFADREIFDDINEIRINNTSRNFYTQNIDQLYDAILAIHSLQINASQTPTGPLMGEVLEGERRGRFFSIDEPRANPYWRHLSVHRTPSVRPFAPPILSRSNAIRTPLVNAQREVVSLDNLLDEIKKGLIESEFVQELREIDKPELVMSFEKLIENTMLEIEKKFINSKMRCSVCMTNMPNIAFVPCGHRICNVCFTGLQSSKCPECNEPYQNKLDLYGGSN